MNFEKLHAGDTYLYTGIIYTARDQAHLRLKKYLEEGKKIPVNFENSLIYYAGPTPTKPGMAIGSIGPTTSSRMDKFIDIMPTLKVSGMIGKGPRDKSVVEACKKYKLVYFIVTGGCGALLSEKVISAEEVMFPDLGCESIKKLYVKDFPLIVAYDIYGNNVFERKID